MGGNRQELGNTRVYRQELGNARVCVCVCVPTDNTKEPVEDNMYKAQGRDTCTSIVLIFCSEVEAVDTFAVSSSSSASFFLAPCATTSMVDWTLNIN